MSWRPPIASLPFRLSQHADFPGSILIPDVTVRHFNRRVSRAGEDDCWLHRYLPRSYSDRGSDPTALWVDPNRYFQVSWTDRSSGFKQVIPAHRLALLQDIGPIPRGLFACHLCSTPACMNPQHLYAGTGLQNSHDRWLKEEIERRTGITDVILPRHPIDGSLRSRFVCEEFISELKAQRMRARLDRSPRAGSSTRSTGSASLPSPRLRPARQGAAIAAV